MKIQCDVCGKEEASVFCTADEAALCKNCDNHVHNANKLAIKHPRFSLLQSQFTDSPPLCDICQENRALMFCREDRALLCEECDIPIHKANEHTKKHNRFLLTGLKLSSSSTTPSSSSFTSGSRSELEETTSLASAGGVHVTNSIPDSSASSTNSWRDVVNESSQLTSQQGSASTSSISEYLIETLPGWHVEDFLDPSNSHFHLCKFQIPDEMASSTNGELYLESIDMKRKRCLRNRECGEI